MSLPFMPARLGKPRGQPPPIHYWADMDEGKTNHLIQLIGYLHGIDEALSYVELKRECFPFTTGTGLVDLNEIDCPRNGLSESVKMVQSLVTIATALATQHLIDKHTRQPNMAAIQRLIDERFDVNIIGASHVMLNGHNNRITISGVHFILEFSCFIKV